MKYKEALQHNKVVIRAMSLPQARIKFEFAKNSAKQESVDRAAEMAFLDVQQHRQLEGGRKALKSGEYLSNYFGAQYSRYLSMIDSISASIVEAA